MSATACLALYSIAVMLLGPPLLRRLTCSGAAPRLGVAAWIAAIASVLGSWIVGGAFLVIDVVQNWRRPGMLIESCIATLRGLASGDAGIAAQAVLLTITLLTLAGIATSAMRVTRNIARARAGTASHADALRMVGQRADAETVIVDASEPRAYCVPGRPGTIVITRAAVEALASDELAAVVAHERAHLSGRHPELCAALRCLSSVFPKVSLFSEGAREVSRQLEMHADDQAVKSHGVAPLLRSLAILAGAVPEIASGAAAFAVLDRVKRLAVPAHRSVRLSAQAALLGAATLLTAGPMLTTALAVTGAINCGI